MLFVATVNMGSMSPLADDVPWWLHEKAARAERQGPNFCGPGGNDQRLPDSAETESESVEELVSEGQCFEATVVDGVEDISDREVAD